MELKGIGSFEYAVMNKLLWIHSSESRNIHTVEESQRWNISWQHPQPNTECSEQITWMEYLN